MKINIILFFEFLLCIKIGDFVDLNDETLPKLFGYSGYAYKIPTGTNFEDFYQNLTKSHSDMISITSPQYPNSYPTKGNTQYKLTVTNSSGIEILIHKLDIDPLTDFLKFTPLNSDGSERRSLILTGNLELPVKIRSVGFTNINVTFGAWTFQNHSFKGFLFSYMPYKNVNDFATITSDIIISELDEIESLSQFLMIPRLQQNNSTWLYLKELLAKSANEYIISNPSLNLELATPLNVTFLHLGGCFNDWPNSENCIDLEFAIILYNQTQKILQSYSFIEQPAGMSKKQLQEMWEQFGLKNFQKFDIKIFHLPDLRLEILANAGILFGLMVGILLIFVAICRMKIVKDNFFEENIISTKENEEKEKTNENKDDITMYPSQNQIISDLNSMRISPTINTISSDINNHSNDS